MNLGGMELGILAAAYAMAQILLAGPLGHLSDRTGRKPVLVTAMLGFAAANVLYSLANDVYVMIIARIIEGAVSAGFFPAANAFVADVTAASTRGKAMGFLSAGGMVGFIIGPTMGGVLAEFFGLRIPFVITALITLVTLAALHLLITEPEHHQDTTQNEGVHVSEILRRHSSAYAALAVSVFANIFALGILEVAFTLDAVERFKVTPLEIGLFFGVVGVVTICGSVGFGLESDKTGRKWPIVVGSFLGAVSMLLFMQATDLAGLLEGAVVLGLAISMRGPTTNAMVADLTDRNAYGVVMGVFGMVNNTAYVIGPLLAGYYYSESGIATGSLLLGSIVSLIGCVTAIAGLPSAKPNSGNRHSEDMAFDSSA
jgi:DHA1 family tetracycline resistance protein-like MFS transporter